MNSSAFSFRVFVPEDSQFPVEFYDDVNAFRVAVVEKTNVGKLLADWDVPAVYVLLGERDLSGGWDAYVGKAPSGVKSRLRQHVRSKGGWTRALVVVRDTTMGMNSAQIGWLEGRLHELLSSEYKNSRMLNTVQPGDKTLMAHDYVEGAVVTVRSCLRVLGYVDEKINNKEKKVRNTGREEKNNGKKVRSSHDGSILDLLNADILKVGTKIYSRVPKWPAEGVILETGEILVNGKKYSSPSAAGRAVKGGSSTNGWSFWGIRQSNKGIRKLAEYRELYKT